MSSSSIHWQRDSKHVINRPISVTIHFLEMFLNWEGLLLFTRPDPDLSNLFNPISATIDGRRKSADGDATPRNQSAR